MASHFAGALSFLLLSATAGAQGSSATLVTQAGKTAPARATLTARATRIGDGMRPPVLDGKLDDPAWALAQPVADFTQYEPSPGAVASERAEARILIDAQAIYVAMRMYDAHPDSIRSQLLRRDDGGASADWASVLLDSYHDRRTAFRFAATPRGTRTDVLQLNDTGADSSWDAVWDVATSVDSQGWTAEFRIPISQLRFSTGGDATWGVNFSRTIGRRAETSYWAPIVPADGRFVSLFADLKGIDGIVAARPIEVLPYTLARLTSDPAMAGNPLVGKTVSGAAAGLDLKYGVTSNFTLTATVNPDFGQVDADPSVVNLGAFENFYPERRPFFTEGTQIFNFPLVPEGYAFYSRRIGRAPQISPRAPTGGFVDAPGTAAILGALKLSGKTSNGTSIGLIAAMTDQANARTLSASGVEATQPIEPATQYFVGRASKDFNRGRSGLGVLATTTIRNITDPAFSSLRSTAVAGGLNGFHRFGADQYQLAGWGFSSLVHGNRAALSSTQRSSVHYWQRPDADGYDYDSTLTGMTGSAGELFLSRIGGSRWTWQVGGGGRTPGFEVNDIGFVSYTDIWYGSAQARYRVPNGKGAVRDWWADLNSVVAHSFGGQMLRTNFQLQTNHLFRNFWSVSTNTDRWSASLWPWELRGGPALRRSGYLNVNANLNSDSRKSWRLRLHGRVQESDELGSHVLGVDPSLSFRPSSSTSVTLTPAWVGNLAAAQYITGVTSTSGAREYMVGRLDQSTVSMTLRMGYALSPTMTLDVYAQPFLSGGRYSGIRRVVDPHASDVDARYPLLTPDQFTYSTSTNRYSVDANRDGKIDFTFANPDFSVRQLRTNTVLRWEFRRGSTLYLVWAQARDDAAVRVFDWSEDGRLLFAAPAKNVIMAKMTYWIDR